MAGIIYSIKKNRLEVHVLEDRDRAVDEILKVLGL